MRSSLLAISTFARTWLRGVAAALVLLPAACHARDLLVVGAHFERVFEQGQDGKYTGIGAEIVRLFAAGNGDTVTFKLYPWARAQAMVAQGVADILVGPYKSAQRELSLAYSDQAFYRDQMVFYGRRGETLVWNGDYALLRGRRIVVLNGWRYSAPFERALPALQASVANTVENGLKMVAFRHVDLFATNRRNTEPVVERLGYRDKVLALPGVIDVQDGYFAFPRRAQSDAMRGRFDQAFKALVDSGELKRLGKRFEITLP